MDSGITIKQIKARQILDSRGNPTVETDVFLSNGVGARASVPSGASTGEGEALELRDGDPKNYHGKSVQKAIWNVNNKIADVLVGNSAEQKTVDNLMIELDGTDNKASLGANATLSVSLAVAKAMARAKRVPFYRYIAEISQSLDQMSLPMPMMNVVNGGAHADWTTDFQEYMIVPKGATTINEAVRMGADVFHELHSVVAEHGYATTVGDEGGYAPHVKGGDDNEPLNLIMEAIDRCGYKAGTDFGIALDIAASEFYDKDHYALKTNGDWKTADDLTNWYEWMLDNYPVVSIEDGLSESDWDGWKMMTARLGSRVQLVGDDLFVTNTKLLLHGVVAKAGNAILIKPNQIGTLSETIDAVLTARTNGFKAIISHRSGETEDVSIAHLAVGLGAGQIKTGSLSRVDRVAKYNELMRIAEGNRGLRLNKPF
jgi:enolase